MRRDWGPCQSHTVFPGLFPGLWGLLATKELLGAPRCPSPNLTLPSGLGSTNICPSCLCDLTSTCPPVFTLPPLTPTHSLRPQRSPLLQGAPLSAPGPVTL